MAFMEEITDYKLMLFKELWNNQEIKDLIAATSNSQMSYSEFKKHVTPYSKNLDTITEKGVYILFDVDITKAPNPTVMDCAIGVWILCSEDILETQNGIRVDLLASAFDKVLNGCQKFGIGRLELQNALTFATSTNFTGRKLTYLSKDFNRG